MRFVLNNEAFRRSSGGRATLARCLSASTGLCCDGTLFHAVNVTADEVERLAARVDFSADNTELLQCCRALEGTRCTVYDERPSTCRTYRCSVLASLERGQCSEEEARAALAEVFALRRAVALAVGVADERAAVRTARTLVHAGSANGEVAAAMRALTRAALILQLP